jgi:hypothetical protein
MDIQIEATDNSWKLTATSEAGANFLRIDYPGAIELPAADAKDRCEAARAAGLDVRADF